MFIHIHIYLVLFFVELLYTFVITLDLLSSANVQY